MHTESKQKYERKELHKSKSVRIQTPEMVAPSSGAKIYNFVKLILSEFSGLININLKNKIMKKIFLSLLIISALALTTVVNVKTADAEVNPDCPNGCVYGSGGCHCIVDYPQYAEAVWPE